MTRSLGLLAQALRPVHHFWTTWADSCRSSWSSSLWAPHPKASVQRARRALDCADASAESWQPREAPAFLGRDLEAVHCTLQWSWCPSLPLWEPGAASPGLVWAEFFTTKGPGERKEAVPAELASELFEGKEVNLCPKNTGMDKLELLRPGLCQPEVTLFYATTAASSVYSVPGIVLSNLGHYGI